MHITEKKVYMHVMLVVYMFKGYMSYQIDPLTHGDFY